MVQHLKINSIRNQTMLLGVEGQVDWTRIFGVGTKVIWSSWFDIRGCYERQLLMYLALPFLKEPIMSKTESYWDLYWDKFSSVGNIGIYIAATTHDTTYLDPIPYGS